MPSIIDTLKAGWTRANDKNAGLLSAGIAYYAFLALVPLLAAIVLTYGIFVDPRTLSAHSATLTSTLPPSAGALVVEQLESVTDARGGASGFGLVAAIALSLFGARVAAGSVTSALNVAFGAQENRSFLRSNLLAITITAAAVLAFGLVGLSVSLLSGLMGGTGLAWLSYGLALAVGFVGAFTAYRVVPNVSRVPKKACILGAGLFAPGWMIAGVGFGFYASTLGNYSATYGSLAGIIVLLTWLFLSAYLLLLGAFVASAKANQVAD